MRRQAAILSGQREASDFQIMYANLPFTTRMSLNQHMSVFTTTAIKDGKTQTRSTAQCNQVPQQGTRDPPPPPPALRSGYAC